MDVVELLKHLVRINSVNAFYPGGPGEAGCAAAVSEFWRDAAIEYRVDDVLPGRPNVLAHLPGRNPNRRFLLEAHMDTVSVDGMTIPPFVPEVKLGRLYGRGSCDTKAGLAGMMIALRRAKQEGFVPNCDVFMAAVMDEEHSCLGIRHLCNHFSCDGAIVAEPTELGLVIASKGVLRWRILARGRAAHSSRIELGVNAIHHMARLIVALEEHHRDTETIVHPLLGRATANVGLISGGVQVNFVPDRCSIEIDRRVLPGESQQGILEGYQQVIRRIEAEIPSASFEIEPPTTQEPCLDTQPDQPLVLCAQAVLQKMGLDSSLRGVAYGSDAGRLQEAKVPSILYGPGSIDRAHTADEYVELEEVQVAHEFYYSMLREFE
ncbi:MAG: M20 family metallopeptidase [Planctomycetota bacterium]|jgi:acetylornithine deacetylase/succinyl-diaminopimelate desuccinylase family protein